MADGKTLPYETLPNHAEWSFNTGSAIVTKAKWWPPLSFLRQVGRDSSPIERTGSKLLSSNPTAGGCLHIIDEILPDELSVLVNCTDPKKLKK